MNIFLIIPLQFAASYTISYSAVTHTDFSHRYSCRYEQVCKEAFAFASFAYRTRVFRQRFFRPGGVIVVV